MMRGHGDDAHSYPGLIRANFSSNVMPGGMTPSLRDHLSRRLAETAHYPEPGAETVTRLLAANEGVPSEAVLVTPGGTGAIYLLAQVFRGMRSCVVIPAFAEYEDACVANGHQVSFAPWRQFAAGMLPAADVVWLSHPNNPTGAVVPLGLLLARVDASPATTFVVDAAYAQLSDAPTPTAWHSSGRSNLVLLQSLTKPFGIPGLRIGYLTAAAGLVARLRPLQPPWAVGSLALVAAEHLVRTGAIGQLDRAAYLVAARELQEELAQIDGIQVEPSETGFFLVRLGRGTGAELKEWLVREHGLLVRDAGNFRGLDEHHVRIAAQSRGENRLLVEAIREWMRG